MFETSLTLVAAAAVVLTAGAIQFGSTRNFGAPSSAAASGAGNAGAYVNRAAKADRALGAKQKIATRTFVIQPHNLSETSILFHIPAAPPQSRDLAPAKSAPAKLKAPVDAARSLVACEPSVSVLTEVARQLAPGRCLT